MFITEPQKLAYVTSVKFLNIVDILQFWIKDKSRAPPYTCSQQITVITLGLCEDVQQRHPTQILGRKMVVDPGR